MSAISAWGVDPVHAPAEFTVLVGPHGGDGGGGAACDLLSVGGTPEKEFIGTANGTEHLTVS